MSLESMLNRVGTIKRGTTITQNAFGEKLPTYTTVYSNVKMRIQPSRVGEKSDYFVAPFIIYMLYDGYTVNENDIIECDGKTYQVVFPATDSSQNHYQLQCKYAEN